MSPLKREIVQIPNPSNLSAKKQINCRFLFFYFMLIAKTMSVCGHHQQNKIMVVAYKFLNIDNPITQLAKLDEE